MIKEVNSDDILEFILKYFPKYLVSSDPFEKVYAYYSDTRIIGFISISSIYERCEINYIVVSEDFRRRGVAQKMLDYIISKNSFNNISLEVREDNVEAINFYLKNGFKKVSIRKNYYGNVDGYLMVKKVI